MKVLVYANAPVVTTGFGRVIQNIFGPCCEMGVFKPDDIAFCGINYDGEPHDTNWNIWPAQSAHSRGDGDLFGRQRFATLALGNKWAFDVLFVLEDHFTLSWPIQIDNQWVPFLPGLVAGLRKQHAQGRPPFKVIQYIPVDSDFVRPEWVGWIPGAVDVPVAYTHYGRRVILNTVPQLHDKLRVIPHGTNPDTFYPLSAEERAVSRKQMFGIDGDDPVILNVNRNQPRKDIPKTLQVFAEVLKRYPKARLVLHMNPVDSAGFNLANVREELRIPEAAVMFPANFSEARGVPDAQLNAIYNAADVYISTSRGEGWGLPVTEAMCAGTPVVAPDHTSLSEILADGRGYLVTPNAHGDVMTFDNDHLRPTVDVPAMAAAVCDLLADPDLRRSKARRAREWTEQLTWRNHVAPQWADIFRACDPANQAKPAASPPRYQLNAGAAT